MNIFRLRSGHNSLISHNYRHSDLNDILCPNCKLFPDSVEHLLLHCSSYNIHRHILKQVLHNIIRRPFAFNIELLLGIPQHLGLSNQQLRSITIATSKFVRSTKRQI